LSEFITIRLGKENKSLIARVCKLRGEDISGFGRRAMLTELAKMSYLSNEQKKALGVLPTPNENNAAVKEGDC
jgi:uncharacterized protein (DUF1778 family)